MLSEGILGRLVEWIWRRPRRVLAIALVVALAAGWFASRLTLRPGLADLLRGDDPAAREHARIAARLPSTLMMVIAIEGLDPDANRRAADRLGERLRGLGPGLVERVVADVKAERAFFADWRWLYAELADLEAIRDTLAQELAAAKNPLLVVVDDDAWARPLLDRVAARQDLIDRFPSGYLEGEAGRFVLVLVRPARGTLGEDVGQDLHHATVRVVDELRPSLGPGVTITLGGNLIVGLAERAALMRDLARASVVCLVLVAVVVIGYFGRLRVVALLPVPSLIGVALAYALAEATTGFVNMTAAFLATIIVGNGINFAVIQQARYDEERRRGTDPFAAAVIAVRTTAPGTGVAALCTAAAYGSLMLTRFRGFSQFGAVGATGIVAAWVATIVVLPALWAVVDAGPARRRFRSLADARWLGWFGRGRRPIALLVAGGALTVAAVAAIPGYLADPFEYDLTKLRDRGSLETKGHNARVEAVLGETSAPPVVLAERRDQVIEIRDRLRWRAATPEGRRLISAIRTIDDFVPDDQDAKLAVLDELRLLIDVPELAELAADARAELVANRPPDYLRAVTIDDLPPAIRDLYTEVDGTVGRIILVYDFSRITAYDGHAQLALDRLIGEVPLADGTVARSPVLFAALIRGIVADAPVATALALLAVCVLVAACERRRRGVALVLGVLVVGVVWMVGAAAWLGVRVNFLNFIALPIAFGIGADYAINMYQRAKLEGPGGVGRAVRAVGGALALCSSTTIIGYGALLVADNQALRSFGALAILGELATLAAAATMLPAALIVLGRRAATP